VVEGAQNCRAQNNAAEKCHGVLVISSGDTTPLFEPPEITFDGVVALRIDTSQALFSLCLVRQAAATLFDLVRLHRQHSVCRLSSVDIPPLDTGMM
jgi:hypothetical protein